MNRPEGFPDQNHPLLEAARYNDAEAEENGLTHVCSHMGIDLPALMHIAKQRAMRIVMLQRGENPNPSQYTTPHFDAEERAEIDTLTAVYLDGIAIGWRGRGINDNECEEE